MDCYFYSIAANPFHPLHLRATPAGAGSNARSATDFAREKKR
jgi:hypothetical protein